MKKTGKGFRKLYIVAGTMAIVTIFGVLIAPFFRAKPKEVSSVAAQTSQIKRAVNPHMTQLVRDFEKEIVRLMDRSGTPGAAIAIVRDSSIVYMKGFGVKSSAGSDSVDVRTVFRIASVSKCFASFLTGMLVENGSLAWNDPVVKYVPDFALNSPEQTAALTISHVLSHTTGLPYHTYTNMVEEGMDLRTMLGMLKDIKPSNDVGKEYSYQNVAFSVIGEVIGSASSTSYEDAMKKHVFGPLDMRDASMDYQSLMTNGNIAMPHRMARRRWVPTKINNTYYNVSPAGGVNASIRDMAGWMTALLGYRENVIERSTLEHMFTPAIDARSRNRNYRKFERPKKSYYGLGWRILHYPNDTIVYHGGYVTGYRSEVGLDPKDEVAVCILSNAPGELADKGIPVFFHLFNKYKASIVEWERQQGVASPKTPI